MRHWACLRTGGYTSFPNSAYKRLHELLATEFGVFSFKVGYEDDHTALVRYSLKRIRHKP
jgi:hypothetical protein